MYVTSGVLFVWQFLMLPFLHMNKSHSTLIHLGFTDRSCCGGFPSTKYSHPNREQLNGIYGDLFLLPIFLDRTPQKILLAI